MTASCAEVYAIILAAGASTRLGSPKQLLHWHQRSLLTHAITNANAVLKDRVFVVLGAHAEAIEAAVELHNVNIVLNPEWREGIASSIRAGVRTLPATAEAAMLLLCDQPLIRPKHLLTLLNAWRNEPTRLVASHYHHSVGVPALFPSRYFEALHALQGDKGAKRLLCEHRQALIEIPLQQAELDIDSIGDFNHLNEHHDAGD